MKKITFFMAMLLISIVTFSQIIDRPADGVNSLISVNGTDGNHVFVADTFTIAADTDLGELDVFGTNSNAVLAPNLSGFTVYIYADVASLPSGDPTTTGVGVLELDVTMADITVLADEDPVASTGLSNYTIDMVGANGGMPFTLTAGTYWLVVAAVTNNSIGDGRWNWATSAEVATVEPVIIDPADLFGAGATSWTNISGLIGATMSSAAWQLREPAGPSLPTDACGAYTSSPGTAFIDNDSITDVITVPAGAGTIADLNVAFDISHTWVGDLDITLTSPAGTSALLFDSCANDDDMNVMFDDDGVAVVCESPTQGVYLPTEALSIFNGEDFEGDWTVTIADTAGGDTGTLNTWCLIPTFVVTCGEPTALTATATDVTADLGWTAGPDAESMWDVEWGAPGFAPGTGAELGMVMATSDNPYTAMGLTAETGYEFYVRAGCTMMDHSDWAGPFAFTTEMTPPLPTDACGAYTSSPGTAFIDNDSITDVITVPAGAGVIADLNVAFDISHTWVGDLDITLTSPAGTSALLFDSCGNDDDMNVMFDDDGVAVVCDSPTQGVYMPTEVLSIFNGEDFEGDWTVTIADTAGGDTGTLNTWCLIPDLTVSVADNVIEGFEFYPNPAKNTINLTALNTIDNVEVFNMVGQKVISQNLNTTSGQLDISRLSAGMYVMKVASNDQVGSYQIVKK